MGRIGSHVAHMSVILILAGGLIGSLLGFRLFGTFYVHSTTFVPQGNFSIRVNKFWIDHYPNGMVKGFFSDVDVLKSGKIIDHKVISVNHPLETNGLRFYQASYGEAWDRVDKARILIVNKEKKQFLGQVMLKGGALSPAPGTDLNIKILRYVADFAFDPKTNSVYSKSEKSDNPAIQLGIYQNGKQIGSPWLFYNFPQIQVMKSLPYFFILGGYEAPMYTGLEVAKDPGVHVILAGSFLLVGGTLPVLFCLPQEAMGKSKGKLGSVAVVCWWLRS